MRRGIHGILLEMNCESRGYRGRVEMYLGQAVGFVLLGVHRVLVVFLDLSLCGCQGNLWQEKHRDSLKESRSSRYEEQSCQRLETLPKLHDQVEAGETRTVGSLGLYLDFLLAGPTPLKGNKDKKEGCT